MAQDKRTLAGPAETLATGAEAKLAMSQDEEADVETNDRWSVTITPRLQQLYFKPSFETDDLEAMTSYGLSVALRSPGSGFGIMGTFMTGEADGDYSIDNSDPIGGPSTLNYAYNATREEYQLTGEFTPRNTNFTLLAGYHRFTAGATESLQNPAPGNTENNVVNLSIDAFELGMRLSSALGEGSRHSVSAQFLFGVGSGKYEATFQEKFGGVTTTTTFDEDATGYMADVAIGYNFFITDNIAIGARARGYAFYVDADADENDPIIALAPELNFSFRF
jgi:hypothetical protein